MSESALIPLSDIQQNLIQIIQLLKKVYFTINYCSDFIDVKHAVQRHVIEAGKYIIICQNSIAEKFPDFTYTDISEVKNDFDLSLQNFNDLSLIESQDIFKIERIHKNISNINILMDRCAINCKFCKELGTRPYVKLLAQAMTEIMELQNFYIYPIRKDLVPEYLQKFDFKSDRFQYNAK